MNGTISIGQYIPTNSIIHKLDPRIKIASLVLLLVTLFLIPINTSAFSLISMGVMVFVSFLFNVIAKIPLKRVIKGIRPLIFLLTFTFFIQLFTIKGDDIIFNDKLVMNLSVTSILAMVLVIVIYNLLKKKVPFKTLFFLITVFSLFVLQYYLPFGKIFVYDFLPTKTGVIRGIFLFSRIVVTVLLTSLLTFTTMTTDLNYGFESLMSPLKVIKVPVEVFAMMLSLILRYIPTLLFETEKIIKAQASRGLDFNESKLKDKVTQIVALLVPIFLISITRAEELSDAMEARGYVIGMKRSRIDEYKIKSSDIFTIVLSTIMLVSIIVLKVIL